MITGIEGDRAAFDMRLLRAKNLTCRLARGCGRCRLSGWTPNRDPRNDPDIQKNIIAKGVGAVTPNQTLIRRFFFLLLSRTGNRSTAHLPCDVPSLCMSSSFMPVAQRGLKRCLRLGGHGRVQQRFHSSAPSPSASPLSVAKLLATPADDGERHVYGFVRSIRKQKTRAFAAIGDGSSLEPLQALLTPTQAERFALSQSVIRY